MKIKLLIAMLSATCIAGSACGFAACKDKDGPDNPPPDTKTSYTITAKDGGDNPVAGVWFEMYYYDSSSFKNVFVSENNEKLLVKTGEDGKAVFRFDAETGRKYSAKITDDALANGERAYPYGYEIVDSVVSFSEGVYSVDYNFNYRPNSFTVNEKHEINYKRVPKGSGFDEIKGENKFTLEKNRHLYFTFAPYSAPANSQDEAAYAAAAAGEYEIKYTSSATLNFYNFRVTNGTFCPSDESGVPTSIIQTATSNTLTLNLTIADDACKSVNYFGICSASDCDVTISVTRKGDATEPEPIPVYDAEFTAPTQKYADNSEGGLTLMPVDGSLSVVKGDDGYYHVGEKTGPTLLINLTDVLPRVGEASLADMPNIGGTDLDNSNYFYLAVSENGQTVSYKNYTDMIGEYAKWVNSDGVYPVDQTIYDFLQLFGANAKGITAKPSTDPLYVYNYLLPCQYYASNAGVPVTGAGTQANPFILGEVKNLVDLSGFTGDTAYFKFEASGTGAYAFTADNGTLASDNGTMLYGKLYCAANWFKQSDGTVLLTLSNFAKTETVINVKIERSEGTGDIKHVETVAGSGTPENPGSEDQGMSAATAIPVTEDGVWAYTVNDDESGVWIKFTASEGGVYKFNSYGSANAQIVYDGHTYTSGSELSINCVSGQTYTVMLTAVDGANTVAGTYFIDITK